MGKIRFLYLLKFQLLETHLFTFLFPQNNTIPGYATLMVLIIPAEQRGTAQPIQPSIPTHL